MAVEGLKHSVVHTAAEALDLIHQGNQNRQVGATQMNADSSRSHCICTIELSSIGGRLSIVDLAGSERQSRTDSQGDRLQEARSTL
jgi:hypothetical protein